MKSPQSLLWVSVGVAGLCLLGCRHNHGVRRSSETVYVAEPQPQPQYVIVREAPPPVIVDRRPSRPSREHIWIDGYWDWNGRQYVRHPGQWARPPRAHAVWVAPRYEKHKQGYRYTRGQWREEQQKRRRHDERRDRR